MTTINSIKIVISDVDNDNVRIGIEVDPSEIKPQDLDDYDQPCVEMVRLLMTAVHSMESMSLQ